MLSAGSAPARGQDPSQAQAPSPMPMVSLGGGSGWDTPARDGAVREPSWQQHASPNNEHEGIRAWWLLAPWLAAGDG